MVSQPSSPRNNKDNNPETSTWEDYIENPNSKETQEKPDNQNFRPPAASVDALASPSIQIGTDHIASAEHDPPSPNHPVSPLTNAHHFISIKLTSKNYLQWLHQLEFFLRGQGLIGFIDGTVPCPPLYDRSFQAWTQQDAAIVCTLISSLSEAVLPLSLGKRTSKSLWDSLRNTFAKASSARTMEFRTRLLDLKQGDLLISEYFCRASLIKDELAAIGKAPQYDDFLCHILHGLKPKFSDMKNSILARKDEPDFEADSNRGGRGRFSSGRGRFQSSGSRFQPRAPWAVCQFCGQQGHLAPACPRLHSSAPSAHSVYARVPPAPSTWFPDTGASHHVTPDLAQLQL